MHVLSPYALICCSHINKIPKSFSMIIDLPCYQIIAVKAFTTISVFYQDSAVFELFLCASEM